MAPPNWTNQNTITNQILPNQPTRLATCKHRIGSSSHHTCTVILLTSAQCHWKTYRVNPASWLFSCLPKTSKHDKIHIQCWIEVIQVSLESKWWDLWFGTSLELFWALWFLSIFFIPLIIPPHWKLLDHQKHGFIQKVSEGTTPSLSLSQSTFLYLDWYLWAPLKYTPLLE